MSIDIITVAYKTAQIFEKLSIPYRIGGYLASSAYGIPRSTLDVDIVIDIQKNQIPLLVKEFPQEEYYIDADTIYDALRYHSSFNIIHRDSMFKIDVFILRDNEFHQQEFLRRVQKNITEDISKIVFFPTPEDIILLKLEWFKMGGEVSERQWKDILGVLNVQRDTLDFTYMNKWAQELGVSSLLQKAIKQTETKT